MILALLLFLAACSFQPQGAYTPPPAEHVDLLKARLAPLQQLSFEARYEYCGYFGIGPNQQLTFSDVVRGGHDGCTPPLPDADLTPIASLHTHGSYDPEVPAEFPTVRDMESDRLEGVNGYVSTPGGRLWYIDSRAMVAVQLCGPGCLPQDPNFHPGDDGEIATRYTHAELKALERAF